VRKNIYKSLTFYWLYREPPEGFTEAIHYGEEYVHNPRLLPSGGIWVNLASAYSQKASWQMQQSGALEPDSEMRELVIKAIKEALRLDDVWNLKFQLLLQTDHPLKTGPDAAKFKGKKDMQIFESDPEVRVLIGLPPKRRENESSSLPKAGSSLPSSISSSN
jgi:hypothetical protein